MGTRFHHRVGQPQVIVEGVQLFGGVEEITCVAESDFGHGGAGLEHRLDRGAHLRHVVESVEDAKDVDARRCGLPHERIRHLGRIGRVSHGIAATEQHLNRHVRQSLAHRRQALPRVFTQESQGDVVGGPAPCLDRQQVRGHPRHVREHGRQIPRAYPRREQRLMSVTKCGVGDGEGGLGSQIRREPDRTQLR